MFENDFVNVDTQKILSPKHKQNLIVIYVESLEKQYGNNIYTDEVLTPFLQSQNELSFNGFYQLPSTKYTLAAIMATQCGFKENSNFNQITTIPFLFPQLKCIPDILAADGYKNFFYKSADLEFANTIFFAKQHNFHVMKGLKSWKQENPNNPDILGSSWGVKDSFLYEQIKKTILEMQKKHQPYSIFATTVDTHGEENYIDPICNMTKKSSHNNIKCADFLLQNFIEWCKKQPFYPNLTIVIVGDHLAHGRDNPIYKKLPENRSIENIIFNSLRHNPKMHKWTTFDLAPTIMEAIGYNMPALGLGRSLFAENKTLVEKYGKKLDIMLNQKSRFLEALRKDNVLKKFTNQNFLLIKSSVTYQSDDELKTLIQYSNQADFALGKVWLRHLNLETNSHSDILLKIDAIALTPKKDRTFSVWANGREIQKITFQKKSSNTHSFDIRINKSDFKNNRLKLEFINNDLNHWNIINLGIGIRKLEFIIK